MKKLWKAICLALAAALTLGLAACGEAEKPQDADITYTVTDTVPNGGGGTVEITQMVAVEGLKYYNLRWGTETGILQNYTPLGRADIAGEVGATATFTVPANTAIPTEATHLWAEGCDSRRQAVTSSRVKITEGAKKASKKLFEFQVFSDYQIISTKESHSYNKHAVAAFKDVQKTSPQTSMIINNGDITEYDSESLYEQFFKNLSAVYGDDAPQLYFTIGNHEGTTSGSPQKGYAEEVATWNKYTSAHNGTDSLYFSKVIHGSYFIFLGSVEKPKERAGMGAIDATLGDAQLDWLEGELKKAEATGNPVYLFLHQSLKDTVSGSLTEYEQHWYGVVENDRLKALVDRYPKLLYFSSHSHWHLQSEGAWQYGGGKAANYFNTAAVGYLWQGLGAGSSYDGSEGLYVEVYEDYLLVRGRSFHAEDEKQNKWIAISQFLVPVGTTAA